MPNQPETYLATIFYTDTDGGKHTIIGAVVAVDYDDAMNAVLDAVSARPDCAQIVGGVIEPVDAETLAALAETKSPHAPVTDDRPWDGTAEHARVLNAQGPYRAPGTTVH